MHPTDVPHKQRLVCQFLDCGVPSAAQGRLRTNHTFRIMPHQFVIKPQAKSSLKVLGTAQSTANNTKSEKSNNKSRSPPTPKKQKGGGGRGEGKKKKKEQISTFTFTKLQLTKVLFKKVICTILYAVRQFVKSKYISDSLL